VGDTDAIVDEIEEFLTGTCTGAEGDVLTMTVLFTDIVASTEYLSRVGPGEWSRCLISVLSSRAYPERPRVLARRRRSNRPEGTVLPPGR
jgi:hypothetical protein